MIQANKAKLTEGSVAGTLIKLTIPMIFGIVSMVVFNLVDTFYVGRLGTHELAALSFTLPVVMVIQSLALGLGMGASVVISRAIGEGNQNKIRRLTTDSLSLSVLVVVLFVFVGLLTINPLFKTLGASPILLPLIRQYMRIWYPGMVFVVIPMVGNNAIRAGGDTKTPGITMMCAASVNFILDPLLIFGIGPFPRLEIAGAALATLFARAIALVISSYILIHRDKMITFTRVRFGEAVHSWKQILFIGLPTAATRMVIPLGVGVITRLVSVYGPESVAAFGVATRIEFFALTIVMALSTIMGPFAGQNWGAGRVDRVKSGIRYGKQFAIGWGLLILTLLMVFARPVATVFNKNRQVIDTIIIYLRTVPFGYGMQGVFLVCATVLNVLKKPVHAAMLSIFQMFLLYIPLAYVGSILFGVRGIFGALMFSYLISGSVTHFVTKRMISVEAKKQN